LASQTDSSHSFLPDKDMTYDSKTNCFAVENHSFSGQKYDTLQTKTICFGVMMVYDAFPKAII
jgi:hypothetical protein